MALLNASLDLIIMDCCSTDFLFLQAWCFWPPVDAISCDCGKDTWSKSECQQIWRNKLWRNPEDNNGRKLASKVYCWITLTPPPSYPFSSLSLTFPSLMRIFSFSWLLPPNLRLSLFLIQTFCCFRKWGFLTALIVLLPNPYDFLLSRFIWKQSNVLRSALNNRKVEKCAHSSCKPSAGSSTRWHLDLTRNLFP